QLVLAALICRGHVLFEDVPGTAKTVLARAIAGSIDGATPSRVQCTPDLQPTDVTGLSVYNQQTRDFEFRPGPVFANILLVEDIYTDDLVLRWTVELVAATRTLEQVALGASVRASLALERTARAWALLQGRDYVTPEDIETLFLPVIGHRVVFTPTFVAENRL